MAARTAAGRCQGQDLRESLGRYTGVDGLPRALEDTRRLVLLLDSFDEVERADRALAREILQTLAEWPGAFVLVSARRTVKPADLGGLPFRVAELQPLGEDDRRQLLQNWFRLRWPDDAAARAQRWSQRFAAGSERLREFAANPFLLTCLAQLVMQKGDREEPDFERGRHELLDELFACVLTRDYRRDDAARLPLPADAVRRVLGHFAWRMLAGDVLRRTVDRGDLEKWLKDGDVTEAVRALKGATGVERHQPLLEIVAEQCGVFGPVGTDGRTWGFAHNLMQEAMCAWYWWHVVLEEKADAKAVLAHLRERMSATPDGAPKQRAGDGDGAGEDGGDTAETALDFWTEPTALLAGWMQDDGLLLPLLRDETLRDLGMRVMRALDEIRPETWAQCLAPDGLPKWAPSDWQTSGPRVAAYELLPHRLPRGAAADAVRMLRTIAGLP